MDRELLVTGAHGESVMRLPWFEDDLFVGRQLPEIGEMPAPVRKLCVKNYSAALGGKRSRFAFTSYGHAYSVDAVPVRGDGGSIDAVLAVATPGRTHAGAACVYERTAQRLADVASRSEERAESHRRAGRSDAEAAQRQAAEKARAGAERARHNAAQLRSRHAGQPATTPSISPREAEVLQLASHGLTHGEIAEELVISPTTVRTHMENIFPKLGVADKAAAVATALRHGLID
jgi:DNA-binding CsgD family transcriptional regulator